MPPTSNSTAVVTKFTQFFLLLHTQSHTVFVATGSLLLFHNGQGHVHLFGGGGTLVQKPLGACKYAALMRMLHASAAPMLHASAVCRLNHRIDSVIESSLREVIGSKNFALVNLSLNFCETTIYDNKVFLKNLVAVH